MSIGTKIVTRQVSESMALGSSLGVQPEIQSALASDAIFTAGYGQGVGAMQLLQDQMLEGLLDAEVVKVGGGQSVGAAQGTVPSIRDDDAPEVYLKDQTIWDGVTYVMWGISLGYYPARYLLSVVRRFVNGGEQGNANTCIEWAREWEGAYAPRLEPYYRPA